MTYSSRRSAHKLAALILVAFAGAAIAADDEVKSIVKDASGKALGPSIKVTQALAANDGAEGPITALANKDVPAPLPSTAEDVEYDAAEGTVEFTSASSVKELADFYRVQMKGLGWELLPSVVNRDNMVVLELRKNQDQLSVTVMRMGPSSQVTMRGSALVGETTVAASTGDGANGDAQNVELSVEEVGGLPVPAPHSLSGSESTLFRITANARTSANLNTVLAFYRRELGKRNWTEQTDKAQVGADSATLFYEAPVGPATLKLGRDNNETTVDLAVRHKSEAMKSPLWPKAGQAKLAFGNMTDKAAVVTVAGKSVRIAAGAGGKKPDGPTLDVTAGKIDMALKSGGHETIEAGPEEIWMIMIGPGGLMAVQAY
jgi:hypothetical protein